MQLFGLNVIATVYVANGAEDGAFTTVAKTHLLCRRGNKGRVGQGREGTRDEEVQNRRLLWSEPWAMPNNAQVDVDGVRWNVVADTYAAMSGLTAEILYRRCDVVRVEA